MKWFDELKKKDYKTKQNFAFFASLVITLLIAGIYTASKIHLLLFESSQAERNYADSDDPTDPQGESPFAILKGSAASIVEVLDDLNKESNIKESISIPHEVLDYVNNPPYLQDQEDVQILRTPEYEMIVENPESYYDTEFGAEYEMLLSELEDNTNDMEIQ